MASTLDSLRSSSLSDQNSITAVHKLPHELITNVFLLGESILGTGLSDTRFLKTITSVCYTWRDAALTTPMLWSNIVIPPAVTISVFEALYDRAEAYTLRSRDASIDVSLTLYSYSKEEIGRIMDLILPHIPRCRTLALKSPDASSLSAYLPLFGRLNRLQRLEVAMGWQNPGPVFVLGESANPPLREVRITGAIGQLLKNIPTGTLHHLHVDTLGEYWASTIAFVSQCTAVQSLWLKIDAEETPATRPTFSLPQLRSLTINDDLTLGFTQYMLTPNLEDLALSGAEWRGNLIDIAPTRFPLLRTLALDGFQFGVPFTVAAVGDLAMRHPHIEKLYLSHNQSYSDILAIFLSPKTNPRSDALLEERPLLPFLEVLHFRATWSRREQYMNEGIVQLLEERPNLCVGCDRYTFGDSGGIEALVRRFGGRFLDLQ